MVSDQSEHQFELVRSVRLTEAGWHREKRSERISKKIAEIWSRETIDPLVEYPEKTDRLEAAAAAGKPGPLVLFWNAR